MVNEVENGDDVRVVWRILFDQFLFLISVEEIGDIYAINLGEGSAWPQWQDLSHPKKMESFIASPKEIISKVQELRSKFRQATEILSNLGL